MSNTNTNTESQVVESAVAESFTDKETKRISKFDDKVTRTLPALSARVASAMKDAFIDTLESGWTTPVSVTIATVDGWARALRVMKASGTYNAVAPFGVAKGKAVIPTEANSVRRDVFDMQLSDLVYDGHSVYTNAEADMAILAAMPDGKSPLLDDSGNVIDESGIAPNDSEDEAARAKRIKAHKAAMKARHKAEHFARATFARKIVASTKFLNGHMVPAHIITNKNPAYFEAKGPKLVSGLETAKKHSTMMAEWFFLNHFATIAEFASRNCAEDNDGTGPFQPLTQADMDKVESVLTERFGGTSGALGAAYAAANAKAPREKQGKLEKLQESVKDISDIEQLRQFVEWAQTLFNSRVAGAAAGTKFDETAEDADEDADDNLPLPALKVA